MCRDVTLVSRSRWSRLFPYRLYSRYGTYRNKCAACCIVHRACNIVIFVFVIAPKVRRVTIVCVARVLGIGTEQGQKACKEQKGTENYYASRRERIGDVSRVNVCEETECGWERNSVEPWRRKNDRKVGRKETWPSTNLDPRTGKDFLESSFVEGDSVFLGWNSVSNQWFLGIDFFFIPVCLNNTLLFFIMLLK